MVNVVLVNGLPGSGKSTTAAVLAKALGADLVSKDTLKLALASACPWMSAGQLGSIAGELQWRIAAAATDTVVIDSWWFAPRDRQYVVDALEHVRPEAAAEVWCDLPPAIARQRYSDRTRHPIFEDSRHLETSWRDWAEHAAPIGVTPVLRFSTAEPVAITLAPPAVSALADRVRTALTRDAESR